MNELICFITLAVFGYLIFFKERPEYGNDKYWEYIMSKEIEKDKKLKSILTAYDLEKQQQKCTFVGKDKKSIDALEKVIFKNT